MPQLNLTMEEAKQLGIALAGYLKITRAFTRSSDTGELLLPLRWRALDEANHIFNSGTLTQIAASLEDAYYEGISCPSVPPRDPSGPTPSKEGT